MNARLRSFLEVALLIGAVLLCIGIIVFLGSINNLIHPINHEIATEHFAEELGIEPSQISHMSSQRLTPALSNVTQMVFTFEVNEMTYSGECHSALRQDTFCWIVSGNPSGR